MTELGSMDDNIRKVIEDDSNRERGMIRFLIRCGSCGEVWRSTPRWIPVATGADAENENKRVMYTALWERELENTRRLAVKEALAHFNLCLVCMRLSCKHCFRICDIIDMCASCAERLGEPGEPVVDDEYPPDATFSNKRER